MNTSSYRTRNITDFPDEILIEIILYLSARERVPLGNSCKRFYTLVFEDKELLRGLDFSKDGCLASATDIHKYFNNEIGNKHILEVNLRNINCIRPEVMLFNYIIKAINLVDINLHGITIRDRWLLRDFLRPLPRVKRLSLDWPKGGAAVVGDPCCKYLQEQFGRLEYMSVRLLAICDFQDFYQALQSCQELKELRMTVISPGVWPEQTILGLELKNLEIITYYGPCEREVANYFVSTFSYPGEWTHFQLSDPLTYKDGFYLERNVQVCEEMLESILINKLSYNYPKFASELGGFVVSVCLLNEVLKMKQENLQEKFCCFSLINDEDEGQMFLPSVFQGSKLWMLKTKEAKMLLKDPGYQIRYLATLHNIEQECDAHIVASAFPSISELVLSNIVKTKQKTSKKMMRYYYRRANKGYSALPHELDQLLITDSSFTKLRQSTPHLRHLTVIGDASRLEDDKTWDLTALDSIPSWKSLTTLRLWHIPIMNGKFFIEIGKQCNQLENIELYDLGPSHTCCYENELLRMLVHCVNLREFTLRQGNISQLSEVFFLLANNPQLRKIHLQSNQQKKTAHDLRPSVEQLLHRCSNLTTFLCLIDEMSEAESKQLTSTLERLKTKLNRSTLQFQVAFGAHDRSTVHQDSLAPFYL